MSLILTSTATPATPTPSGKTGAKATTRSDEQDQGKQGSFGEALARSLEPAGEKTEKPIVKTGNLATARRQADTEETETDDLVNLMALSLAPLESRVAGTVLPSGSTGAAGIDKSAAGSTDVLSNNPLSRTLAPTGEPIDISAASANTQQQALLVSGLTAASPKNAGQTPLQVTAAPEIDDAEIEIDPLLMAGQTEDDAARADLPPVLPRGASKAAASSAAASTPENAASRVTLAPVGTDATVSISAALPLNQATSALQMPGGVTASSAPNPTANTTLVPEVGSSEWGKALSQQVVYMGNAGQQVAELQLNPPGLGPLKVTLSMNDQQIQALFVSAHSSVRAAVEAALPQLRATLAESGISLGNTSVGAESQPQTAFSNEQNGQRDRGAYRPAGMADTATLLQARAVTEPARRNGGMRIDTYA